MINITDVRFVGFTMLVQGDGGAEQFIATSHHPDLDNQSLVISSVGVDADPRVRCRCHRAPRARSSGHLQRELLAWCTGESEPTETERSVMIAQIDDVVRQFQAQML